MSVAEYIRKAIIIKNDLDTYLDFKIPLNGNIKYNHKKYSITTDKLTYDSKKNNSFTVKDDKTNTVYKFKDGKIVLDDLILHFYKKYSINNISITTYLSKGRKHEVSLEYMMDDLNFYIEKNIVYLYKNNNYKNIVGVYLIPNDEYYDIKNLKYKDYSLKLDEEDYNDDKFNFILKFNSKEYIVFNLRVLFNEETEMLLDPELDNNLCEYYSNIAGSKFNYENRLFTDDIKEFDGIIEISKKFVNKTNFSKYDENEKVMITKSGYKVKMSKEIFDSIKNIPEETILNMYSNSNKKAKT